MSQYFIQGDGVTRRFTLPFDTSFITVLPAGATVATSDSILFSVAPAYGASVSISFELPAASGGGSGGTGGGLTEAQYDALVQDPELDAAVAQVGPLSGEVRLVVKASGQADAGWSRTSGLMVSSNLWGQLRFVPINALSAPRTSSENKVWSISTAAGLSSVWDLGTSANTTMANWPGNATNGLGSAVASDEFAWTLGGNSASATGTTACYRFTLSSNTWTQIANLPAARNFGLAARLADGRLLFIGGTTASTANTPASMVDTCSLYTPGANTWVAAASLPFRASTGYATRLTDGRIFCVWSTTSADGATLSGNKAAVYDPAANAWTELDAPSFAGLVFPSGAGLVTMLSSTTGNAQTFNFASAVGSRWTSTPYTAPTGLGNLSFSTQQFTQVMANGQVVPVLQNAAQIPMLFAAGTLSTTAGSSFYVTKD